MKKLLFLASFLLLPILTIEAYSCPSNSSYSYFDETCICNDRYKVSKNRDKCVQAKCPDLINGYRNSYDEGCYCNSGYVWNSTKTRCAKDTTCPEGAYFVKDDETCKCKKEYYINDKKTACNRIPRCPKNGFFSLKRKECECEPGFRMGGDKRNCLKNDTVKNGYIGDTGKIKCYDGFRREGKKCIPRDLFEKKKISKRISTKDVVKKIKTSFVPKAVSDTQKADIHNLCSEGYMWYSILGKCVTLPTNAHPVDTISDAWICNTGYIEKNNYCFPIVSNTYVPESKSRCSDGYMWYSIIGRCVILPANAHIVNSRSDAWLCNNGYKEKDNRCFPTTQCPVHSQYMEEVGKCICEPKYTMLGEICVETRSITNTGIVYDYDFCKSANKECKYHCSWNYWDFADTNNIDNTDNLTSFYFDTACDKACDRGGSECEEENDKVTNCSNFLKECLNECDENIWSNSSAISLSIKEYCTQSCDSGYNECSGYGWMNSYRWSNFGSKNYFHGYRCTKDCSGHKAGYNWAIQKGITQSKNCGGSSESFREGCRIYLEELYTQ